MKTFSILLTLVCIGFVLMLVGDSVAQVEFGAVVESVVERTREYRVGDTVTLVITLKRNGVLQANQPVTFRALGFVDKNNRVIKPDPKVAKVTPASANTTDTGQVEVVVTLLKAGRIGIEADASALDALYVHAFAVGEEITRIVATPWVGNVPLVGDAAPPLAVGDTFTYSIEINNVINLASWQMDLTYNPMVLEAIAVSAGDFLASGDIDIDVQFSRGRMSKGKITSIWQARFGRTVNDAGESVLTGASGSGALLSIEFRVKEFAEEALGLSNVQLSTPAYVSSAFVGEGTDELKDSEDRKPHLVPEQILVHDRDEPTQQRISYQIRSNPVVVTHQYPRVDVNRDKVVNIQDLVEIAMWLENPHADVINPRADVNDDGIVNTLDLALVAGHSNWGKTVELVEVRAANKPAASAPLSASVGQQADLTPETIQGWIDLAQVEDDGSAIFDLGIANLERLLHATVPEETKLLLNYPNPFNPETWIPYQLAKATDVSVSIYSVNGALVRTLALGHQAAGVYSTKSRAAYWDGRNELGERIASGVYFYTLTAGDFSATGKMLVRK